jgi:hypothetical protein
MIQEGKIFEKKLIKKWDEFLFLIYSYNLI